MHACIYNDKDEKIKITELTATIEYYYTDGNVYLQSFMHACASVLRVRCALFHVHACIFQKMHGAVMVELRKIVLLALY
jgi:hypothetical protein